jgi:outer membrane immunogenic protein
MSRLDSGNNTGVVMNKLLVTTIGLVALAATPALSADMPVKYKAPPVPIWSWTGCYIGGNVGAGWRRDTWTINQIAGPITGPTVVGVTDNWGDSQLVGGGQAGCNYQWSNWVIGFELGATGFSSNNHNLFPIAPVLPLGFPAGSTGFIDLTNATHGIYSASARLGYAWDRWLWYVKGGYAYTTVDLNAIATTGAVGFGAALANGGAFAPAPSAIRMDGFVAGAGVEYALTDHLIAGLEYDYYGFRGNDTSLIDPLNPVFSYAYTGIRHDVQTVTARLSFFIPAWGYAPAPAPIYSK